MGMAYLIPCHVFYKAWKEAFWRVLSIKKFHSGLIKLNHLFLLNSETIFYNCSLDIICVVTKQSVWFYNGKSFLRFQTPMCRRTATFEKLTRWIYLSLFFIICPLLSTSNWNYIHREVYIDNLYIWRQFARAMNIWKMNNLIYAKHA